MESEEGIISSWIGKGFMSVSQKIYWRKVLLTLNAVHVWDCEFSYTLQNQSIQELRLAQDGKSFTISFAKNWSEKISIYSRMSKQENSKNKRRGTYEKIIQDNERELSSSKFREILLIPADQTDGQKPIPLPYRSLCIWGTNIFLVELVFWGCISRGCWSLVRSQLPDSVKIIGGSLPGISGF